MQLERATFGVAGAQFEIFWLAMGFAERRKARLIRRAQRNRRVGVFMMRRLRVVDEDRQLALAGDRMNLDLGRPFLARNADAIAFFQGEQFRPAGPRSARILPPAVARTKRCAKISVTAPEYSTMR